MKKIALVLFWICNHAYSQLINVQVNPGTSTDPAEVHAAMHPLLPGKIIAAANMNYVYASNDSAKTWSQSIMSSSLGTLHGDPCLTFDSSGGNLYCAHILSTFGSILVQRSTDCGATWNDGIGVGQNGSNSQDKSWICTEKYFAPYKNNLYLAWTDIKMIFFGPTLSRIRFARSTDSAATFDTPIDITPYDTLQTSDKDGYNIGTSLSTGPNGEIYLCWTSLQGIKFCESTDGGLTFSAPVIVGTQPNGGSDYAISGLIRYLASPVIATDHSTNPYSGNIYIAWSDCRNGSANSDIFIVRSSDGGSTWSAATKVNTDAGTAQQFMPAITVDPVTGYLYVMYYDRRSYTNDRTDVYISRSIDGGNSFGDTRVTLSPFLPTTAKFLGDYNVVEAKGKLVYPIWSECDSSSNSVWAAPMVDTMGGLSVSEQLDKPNVSIFPSPTGNTAYFATKNVPGLSELLIYDLLGKRLITFSLKNRTELIAVDLSAWAAGTYFCRLESNGNQLSCIKFFKFD